MFGEFVQVLASRVARLPVWIRARRGEGPARAAIEAFAVGNDEEAETALREALPYFEQGGEDAAFLRGLLLVVSLRLDRGSVLEIAETLFGTARERNLLITRFGRLPVTPGVRELVEVHLASEGFQTLALQDRIACRAFHVRHFLNGDDAAVALDQLMTLLPIDSWSQRAQDDAAVHLGPVFEADAIVRHLDARVEDEGHGRKAADVHARLDRLEELEAWEKLASVAVRLGLLRRAHEAYVQLGDLKSALRVARSSGPSQWSHTARARVRRLQGHLKSAERSVHNARSCRVPRPTEPWSDEGQPLTWQISLEHALILLAMGEMYPAHLMAKRCMREVRDARTDGSDVDSDRCEAVLVEVL